MKHLKDKTMPNYCAKSKRNSTNYETPNVHKDAPICTITTQPRRLNRWQHNPLKPEPIALIAREQLPLF